MHFSELVELQIIFCFNVTRQIKKTQINPSGLRGNLSSLVVQGLPRGFGPRGLSLWSLVNHKDLGPLT